MPRATCLRLPWEQCAAPSLPSTSRANPMINWPPWAASSAKNCRRVSFSMNEPDLVAWLQPRAGKHRDIVLGIGDDCAIVRPRAGEDLLFTTDPLIEGVHFTADLPATAIGERALARSLSDLAAMGGEPRF